MAPSDSDKIICNGLVCVCDVGFHDFEKGVEQKLSIDFEADVPRPGRDEETEVLPLDYYVAADEIRRHLKSRRYNLIETVGDEIAALLLEKFRVPSVAVRVTKFPADIAEVASVAFFCRRTRAA